LLLRSTLPGGYSIRMSAVPSQIAFGAKDQSQSFPKKVAGNAPGSANVKFPWPSFKSTATCLCCKAVLTSTSSASSPFTSRATICSPPAGAITPNTCAAPAVSCNRMEYRELPEKLPFCTSTVARSGFRSPSKSAIAKVELNPAEEPTGCGAVVLAAFTHPAAPRTKQRTRTARKWVFAESRLFGICESINSSFTGSVCNQAARISPVRIPSSA